MSSFMEIMFYPCFSPHKALLWNNADRNKSLFSPRWFNNNLNCILSVFDDFGNILTYEQFMNLYHFPVPPKEYTALMRAIPVGLTQLIKSHLKFSKGNSVYPALCLGGIDILDGKCNNKHISDRERLLQEGNSTGVHL